MPTSRLPHPKFKISDSFYHRPRRSPDRHRRVQSGLCQSALGVRAYRALQPGWGGSQGVIPREREAGSARPLGLSRYDRSARKHREGTIPCSPLSFGGVCAAPRLGPVSTGRQHSVIRFQRDRHGQFGRPFESGPSRQPGRSNHQWVHQLWAPSKVFLSDRF